MANRRFSTRFPLRREATLSISELGRKPVLMLDISLGGSGILAPFSLSPGTSVYLDTELPGDNGEKNFAAQCRVTSSVSVRDQKISIIGLEFVTVNDNHRKSLTQFARMY